MSRLLPFTSEYLLEAHTHAATIYLRGALSAAGALRALGACDALPHPVRALVVDLRGVARIDAQGLAALHHLLRRWRHARGGRIRVLPPAPRAA